VVRFARGGRLVTAAGELAPLVAQRDQAPQVDRDLVGLALLYILYLSQQYGQRRRGMRETAAQDSIICAAEPDLRRSRVGAHPTGQRRPTCAAARVAGRRGSKTTAIRRSRRSGGGRHRARSSRPPVPPSVYSRDVQTRARERRDGTTLRTITHGGLPSSTR
jgi:hypothetical protein